MRNRGLENPKQNDSFHFKSIEHMVLFSKYGSFGKCDRDVLGRVERVRRAKQKGRCGDETVFKETNVSGALAASIFHDNKTEIPILKQFLKTKGITVRI